METKNLLNKVKNTVISGGSVEEYAKAEKEQRNAIERWHGTYKWVRCMEADGRIPLPVGEDNSALMMELQMSPLDTKDLLLALAHIARRL